jgi:hypothetical protein
MENQSLKYKMTDKNVKTKNGSVKNRVVLNRFFVCCFSFVSFLNFNLYFCFLMFNFYIYRFWQRINYIDLRLCYLYRCDIYNKGGLR